MNNRFFIFVILLLLVMPFSIPLAQGEGSDKSLREISRFLSKATIAWQEKKYKRSENYSRKAVSTIRENEAYFVMLPNALNSLAAILNVNEKPLEAERAAREALILFSLNPPQHGVQLAEVTTNLGESLRLQHRLEEARESFEESKKILDAVSTVSIIQREKHYDASNMVGRGAIEAELGNLAVAQSYYEEALPIFLSGNDQYHPLVKRYIQEHKEILKRIEEE